MQAKTLLVTASPKDVQTPKPANDELGTHHPVCAGTDIGAPVIFSCKVPTDLKLPFAPVGTLCTVL